jgi:photosystem II stability/assembly factor-like uncharacterized protein
MPTRQVILAVAAACLFLSPPARAVEGTWTLLPGSPLPDGGTDRHDDIWFVDESTGWMVNGIGDIHKTADGGSTWILQANTGRYNRAVTFTDSQTGFVGHLNATNGIALTKTTNGGLAWNPVMLPVPVPHGICGLWAAGEATVYGVGAYYGYPTLVKTTNNGATWTTKDMSPWCGALVDCYFWHPDSGIAVGSTPPGATRQPRILTTYDGGDTWTVSWTGPRMRELCWKISFPSRDIGYVSIENLAGTGSAYFVKTKDGGLTWTESLFSATYRNCQGIGFVDETIGWLGGWSFQTEGSGDGGETWSADGWGLQINRFRFPSPNVGYACGDRIYKWLRNQTGTPAAPPPSKPGLLAQNSPNPFDRTTRIRYRVEFPGPVTLRLFDVQGREVRTLFCGSLAPGEYSVSFDAGDLVSGIYTYRLTSAGRVESRKMWLIR